MHYLTNYYRNLSEQLQEKVNFLEKQLNEYSLPGDPYVAVPTLKTGKGGNYAEWKDAIDKRNAMKRAQNLGLLGKKPDRKPIPSTTTKPETKPAKPGISIYPERKPLIGKVPMLVDTDAINVIPKRDRYEINSITPQLYKEPDRSMSQSEVDDEGNPTGLVRVTPKKPKVKRFGDSGPKIRPAPRKKVDFLDKVSEMPSDGTIPSNLKPISPGSKIYTPLVQDYSTFRDRYGIKKDTGPTPKYRG
jgi:hypothetical protein